MRCNNSVDGNFDYLNFNANINCVSIFRKLTDHKIELNISLCLRLGLNESINPVLM